MYGKKCWRNARLTCVLTVLCIFCWGELWTVLYSSHQWYNMLQQREIGSKADSRNDSHANTRDESRVTKGNSMGSESSNPKIKKIMDFNPRPTAIHHFTFSRCECKACAMTSNPAEADLLMFNGLHMQGISLPPRPTGQIWLMYTREPPSAKKVHHLKRLDLRNQFNWTRTVLNDSTFQVVYGNLEERAAPRKDYEAIFKRKQHTVAWFVSKCKTASRREDYVTRMASQVDVHVYGLCGNRTCGARGYDMGGNKTECLEMLSQSYKAFRISGKVIGRPTPTVAFNIVVNTTGELPNPSKLDQQAKIWLLISEACRQVKMPHRMLVSNLCLRQHSRTGFYLAFENSFCRDYITEKFFAMFAGVDVIPVVRGGGDYRKLFPPGLYVNAEDFESPESLGKYLNRLSRDKSAYIKMLQVKNRYTAVGGSNFHCNLCKALHQQYPRNVYRDIYSWLRRPGNCWDPEDLAGLQIDHLNSTRGP